MAARHFYHGTREPEAHFMAAGRIYSGLLTSYWSQGVQLLLHQAPAFSLQQPLTRVHFAKYARQNPAPDLRVTKIAADGSQFVIEAEIRHVGEAVLLEQAVRRLEDRPLPRDASRLDVRSLPRFTRQHNYSASAVAARVAWVEQVSGTKLHDLARHGFKAEALAGNIENFIGAVQIPVGVAGPLHVRGVYVDSHVPLPLATTEGALVSSVTRGAAVCNRAGGVQAHVCRQTMVRAPVFFCADMAGAVNLERWIVRHQTEIRTQAESVSSVARLEQIRTHVFDNTLHVQFYYTTGDASGQNMTSACTYMACRWIKKRVAREPAIGLERYMVEGNLSGDKKINAQNFTLGRGIAVSATCRIPGLLLKELLRVTPAQFVRGYQAAESAALQAGMVGCNINFANIIAGIFGATGQDIASVHESAAGYLKARQEGEDLVLAAYLPSLVIGTVGGGTKLPTQRECLGIMGCHGAGKAFRLAEIIGAACLALDLSTGAAIVTNEFVHSHEHFGRNRPLRQLSWAHIDKGFFNALLADETRSVEAAEKGELDTRNAIISQVAQTGNRSVSGLFRYRLRLRSAQGVQHLNAVLKIKPPEHELMTIGAQVARLTGEDTLGGLFEAQCHIFNLENSPVREIALYAHGDARFHPYWPAIYGTRCDDQRQIYAILMEDLSACEHLDTADRPSVWTPGQIEAVLAALVDLHAIYWNRRPDVPPQIPVKALNPADYRAAQELLAELTAFNASRYPALVTPEFGQVLNEALRELPALVEAMRQHPMTLTHNDFNPRNLCLRRSDRGPQPVVYDWELSLFQNPHHDLVEFLVFTLAGDAPLSQFDRYCRFYFERLGAAVAGVCCWSEFQQGLALNAVELALVRFNLYLMGHNLLHFTFMERVHRNLARLIQHWRPHLA